VPYFREQNQSIHWIKGLVFQMLSSGAVRNRKKAAPAGNRSQILQSLGQ